MMTRHSSRSGLPAFFILSALVALLLVQGLLQVNFEKRHPDRRVENLLYLPSGEHLKVMSLGFRTLMADALWVKAIGYFGGHRLADQEYPWLHHILHPYLFGGLVLSVEGGDPEKAIALLRKAMYHYPGDWRFPFYIGFNYFSYLKDPAAAAEYLQVAATLPGHPEYLPRLAASLLTKAGRVEAAIAFLATLARNTRDEGVRAGLHQKIESLRAGKIPDGLEGFLSEESAADE